MNRHVNEACEAISALSQATARCSVNDPSQQVHSGPQLEARRRLGKRVWATSASRESNKSLAGSCHISQSLQRGSHVCRGAPRPSASALSSGGSCSSPFRLPGGGKFYKRGSKACRANPHQPRDLSHEPVKSIRPCLHPHLREREQLLELARQLRVAGFVGFTPRCRAKLGVFAVSKKNGAQRLTFDCPLQQPPVSDLATPSALKSSAHLGEHLTNLLTCISELFTSSTDSTKSMERPFIFECEWGSRAGCESES